MIVLPDRTTSEEEIVTHFWNSEGRYQMVTDGPDATCPGCDYPERHRVYEDRNENLTLLADGCPSCETSRIPDHSIRDPLDYPACGHDPMAPHNGKGVCPPKADA